MMVKLCGHSPLAREAQYAYAFRLYTVLTSTLGSYYFSELFLFLNLEYHNGI